MSTNESPALTLVTGSAGKTGRAIIRALSGLGSAVRCMVRGPAQRAAVEALGVHQVVEADLLDGPSVRAATRGIDAVYHICPNVHPAETEIGRNVIAAAARADVERFVFHSVLHPQTQAMPHHWAKLRVEESLLESGLRFTILQPAPYMQNVLGQWDQITNHGVYRVPYALDTRIAMVDLQDVATVGVGVLREPGHGGATYELCAPDLLDQAEIASVLGSQLGRPVCAETESLDLWRRRAGCRPGSYRCETLLKMFRYYERYGFAGSSRVLEALLGRPPSSLAEVVARQLRSLSEA